MLLSFNDIYLIVPLEALVVVDQNQTSKSIFEKYIISDILSNGLEI